MKPGTKYYPLYQYLMQQNADDVRVKISDIAALGIELPASASNRRAWWSNREQGAVQAKAWMSAGYHVSAIDLDAGQITFSRPKLVYHVKRKGDIVLWNAELIRGLRRHMGMTQAQLADELGMRQQTISEWETGMYEPSRANSKMLQMVAERAEFHYEIEER